MVGMSGKASEPRRGQSSQQKKAAAGSLGSGGGSNKTHPPPEALHVANILGDSIYPEDLPHKMAQVMAMLPSCKEEEVCIALHDHDFDPEKAISALLDSDPHSRGQVTPSTSSSLFFLSRLSNEKLCKVQKWGSSLVLLMLQQSVANPHPNMPVTALYKYLSTVCMLYCPGRVDDEERSEKQRR